MTLGKRLVPLAIAMAALGELPAAACAQDEFASDAARLAAALKLHAGQTVADIGAGRGQLTLELARVVGPSGRVYATELDADRLRDLRKAADDSGTQERHRGRSAHHGDQPAGGVLRRSRAPAGLSPHRRSRQDEREHAAVAQARWIPRRHRLHPRQCRERRSRRPRRRQPARRDAGDGDPRAGRSRLRPGPRGGEGRHRPIHGPCPAAAGSP